MITKKTLTRQSIDELAKVCPGVTVPERAMSTIYGCGNGSANSPFTWDEYQAFLDQDYVSATPFSGLIYYLNESGNLEATTFIPSVDVTANRPGGSGSGNDSGNTPKPEEEDVSGNKTDPNKDQPKPPTIGGGGGGSTNPGSDTAEGDGSVVKEDTCKKPSKVTFKEGVNSENISAYVTELLQLSIPDATLVVTSTTRSPRQQAQAMVLNIERTGIGEQLNIYAAPGKSVLQVYDSNKSRDANISALTAKIIEVGPSSVSKHCADFTKVNVLDIRISSVPENQRSIFWAYMQNHPNVSQILIENNVYHIVILLP